MAPMQYDHESALGPGEWFAIATLVVLWVVNVLLTVVRH